MSDKRDASDVAAQSPEEAEAEFKEAVESAEKIPCQPKPPPPDRSAKYWLSQSDILEPQEFISTSYFDMDRMLNGGLAPGGLYVFAATTGGGKSSCIQNIARRMALNSRRVLLISLEDQPRLLFKKMVAAEANVPVAFFKRDYRRRDEEIEAAQAARERLLNIPLQVEDTICELQEVEKLIRAENGNPLSIVLVDQSSWLSDATTKTPYELNARASRSMKRLARDLNVPIMVCVQINRAGARDRKDGQRLQLFHLRDSGTWENDADGVIFIQDVTGSDDPRVMTLSVAKHRHGPAGEDVEFKLLYYKRTQTISDWDSTRAPKPEAVAVPPEKSFEAFFAKCFESDDPKSQAQILDFASTLLDENKKQIYSKSKVVDWMRAITKETAHTCSTQPPYKGIYSINAKNNAPWYSTNREKLKALFASSTSNN
jgi:KaiC/GvpD/RAD55 family RecA-like ATPase